LDRLLQIHEQAVHQIVDGIRGLAPRAVRFLGEPPRQIFLVHDYKLKLEKVRCGDSKTSNPGKLQE
jgi:hypothetical protein